MSVLTEIPEENRSDAVAREADWRRVAPEVHDLHEAMARGRRRAARRSACIFLLTASATFLLCLAAMFAFSWYVNPWGDFGPTGFHRLYNARLAKADYLDGLPRDRLPAILVLGSSNTMSYSPATITAKLGDSAFNFGVFWGRAEDFLCIARHLVHDLHHRPKLLIVGTDTWTMAASADRHPVFPNVHRRLLNAPQLVRHHPGVHTVGLRWAKFIDAFSRQQLAFSWKLVRDPRYARAPQPGLVESRRFAADGTRTWYGGLFNDGPDFFARVERGQFPMTDRIREVISRTPWDQTGLGAEFYNFREFSDERIGYMEELLALCQGEGIRIVFVINPVHPDFRALLEEHTRHAANLERLRALLTDWQRRYPVVLGAVDASRIEDLGGDPDGFFDAMHPASANCDLIVAQVARLAAGR